MKLFEEYASQDYVDNLHKKQNETSEFIEIYELLTNGVYVADIARFKNACNTWDVDMYDIIEAAIDENYSNDPKVILQYSFDNIARTAYYNSFDDFHWDNSIDLSEIDQSDHLISDDYNRLTIVINPENPDEEETIYNSEELMDILKKINIYYMELNVEWDDDIED